MPVNDYGGFHEEDESVEWDFAFQQERTTLNSKVMYTVKLINSSVILITIL